MKKYCCTFSLCIVLLVDAFARSGKRPIRPDNIYRLQTLSDANISPDGQWIAYSVSTVDSAKYKRNADIWMVVRHPK